jgi:hypothetical protein
MSQCEVTQPLHSNRILSSLFCCRHILCPHKCFPAAPRPRRCTSQRRSIFRCHCGLCVRQLVSRRCDGPRRCCSHGHKGDRNCISPILTGARF